MCKNNGKKKKTETELKLKTETENENTRKVVKPVIRFMYFIFH